MPNERILNWNVSQEERALISQIVDRAAAAVEESGAKCDRLSAQMDLTAAHANGCHLRLADLLEADRFDLMHDVLGIAHHINRETGEIGGCFLPRFAA